MRGQKRSRSEWQALLAGWRSSGQSMSGYAREQGVPANSLAYWAKRDAGEGVRLVRVETNAPPAEADVSVAVDGAILRTTTAAPAEWMALLLRHLGSA